MYLFGFSLNALSLFGWCWRSASWSTTRSWWWRTSSAISNGLSPRDAAHQAMNEVTGPIVATALVLCAVFVPTAFISGLTGQFYRQFALTIAISTVISAFNSLTCRRRWRRAAEAHDAPEGSLTRGIDAPFGWLFRPFNRIFRRAAQQPLRRRRETSSLAASVRSRWCSMPA
jgi:multidrug efflux pump